jgi:GNAT superfamily N-acetyltransferase
MPSFQIRRARIDEADQLSAIAVASKRLWGYSDAQMQIWQADLQITEQMISAHDVFVAERDGGVAGFYCLIVSADAWTLEHLWVLPAFNRQGIGHLLVEHAKSVAAAGGAEAIQIDADPNADAFYMACGAYRTGTESAPIDGQPDRVRPQLVLPITAV